MAAERGRGVRSAEEVQWIHDHKTAALIGATAGWSASTVRVSPSASVPTR